MTTLNPTIHLSEPTKAYKEFIDRHKIDWPEINFKQYQILLLTLLEDYFYMFDVNDQEFREILQTLVTKRVGAESKDISQLKELVYQLHKYSNDTGSRWFRAFLDDARKYFDDHTHLLH